MSTGIISLGILNDYGNDQLINISNLVSWKLMHRHWDERGIGWARENPVRDIDDTAMGLRILRLHGYNVSSGKMFMYRTVFILHLADSEVVEFVD